MAKVFNLRDRHFLNLSKVAYLDSFTNYTTDFQMTSFLCNQLILQTRKFRFKMNHTEQLLKMCFGVG